MFATVVVHKFRKTKFSQTFAVAVSCLRTSSLQRNSPFSVRNVLHVAVIVQCEIYMTSLE